MEKSGWAIKDDMNISVVSCRREAEIARRMAAERQNQRQPGGKQAAISLAIWRMLCRTLISVIGFTR